MTAEIGQTRELIRRCLQLRESHVNEAVLRSEIVSRLRLIFTQPEDESWINHYSRGTEARTSVRLTTGATARRFIDNLVGSTTIEYEADLRMTAKKLEGCGQVKEHVAGLIRSGSPPSQVRGVLSDTVEWYVYDVVLESDIPAQSCTADDVTLTLIDSLLLEIDDEPTAERFFNFIRRHLAREQSRPLVATLLTTDLGLDSMPYQRRVGLLVDLVEKGRDGDSSIHLATELWSQFVDYLEGEFSGFRTEAYVDEVYLSVLARLLTANVLMGYAISSDDQELIEILDGSYYRRHYNIDNMVEQDYFGWLTSPSHVGKLLPVAQEVQRDLYAYDFGIYPEEDLFGRLMAQLARRSQRTLLGQEWTPSWLARLLAERCLGNLPDEASPRIVDMCCGSGSILAEILKAARTRFNLSDMSSLHDVATGFDIDPLAVSLAKATWVATLVPEIKTAESRIEIPVYHADSLFAVTPVSKSLPLFGETDIIEVSLDGEIVEIPNSLVQPEYRKLFDHIIDWVYDEALDAKRKGYSTDLTRGMVDSFLQGSRLAVGVTLSPDLEQPVGEAVYSLARRMADLAIADRNGIWAFILRNAYRPGLLTGQFNGLVSNPPWLAMSRLAENPYRSMLVERARIYNIQPEGPSFLHLELGTTHLLHAVDRYLALNASIACLVPGTILNGSHHEAFRRRRFLDGQRSAHLEIEEVWQVMPGTFKYPGAAIVGTKGPGRSESKSVSGFVAKDDGLEEVEFSERSIGTKRTAWVLEQGGNPAATYEIGKLPQQGADLMPRVAVCIDTADGDGEQHEAYECQVSTPNSSSKWSYTVKAAKELKGERFTGSVAPQFVFEMAQSENLLPFLFGEHRAPVAIPALRDDSGEWTLLDPVDIRRKGYVLTARWFANIDHRLKKIGKGKPLGDRIDERGKLTNQVFGSDGHLMVVGAGGKYICAATIPLEETANLVVDQTLYWQVIGGQEEAWYRVGVLNSDALTQAITPFNPRGAFGERHIHSLPYRLVPPYDQAVEEHVRIAELSERTAKIVRQIVAEDNYLRDPRRALHVRRSKVRKELKSTPEYMELDFLCSALLGTTAYDEDL